MASDTLDRTVQNAIEDLHGRIKSEELEEADLNHLGRLNSLSDTISEIADSAVSVYNYDLLRLAADNLHLALDEPDCSPFFDGRPTPVNIIAANIFEHVLAALWAEVRRIEADGSL